MAKNYENLAAWKNSIEFAALIYRITTKFPADERYGLTAQIRRAAISISSNIAEGAGRGSKREFLRFTLIALSSLNEVESQLHVGRTLGYLPVADERLAFKQAQELGNILGGLRNYLKRT